jgi:exodeoxyribonuclease V gamma subunit
VLHTHRAASGAALAGGLATLLATPPDDPFAADVVAVPARGIERWLAQRLSHTLGAGPAGDGVCAQVAFPHPDELLDAAAAAASPEHADARAAWHPDHAVWPLLDVLDALPDAPWCAGLRHHLGLDGDGPRRSRYAVARRISGLFAAYGDARPELLRAWAAGDDTGVPDDLAWQPQLWRRLRDAIGGPSPAELLDDTCATLRAHPDRLDLPPRLSLYGPSRIPTARLQVLAALAEHRDVHLWLHHPSPALWESLQQATPSTRRRDVATSPRHPLLASLSRDVRELQLRLAAAAPGHADTCHDPEPPAPATLLQRLQADLRTDAATQPTYVADPADRSVQIHACHGRARQVEVLREVILGLLADDPTLEPRDVLVLCPDVDAYAPLVAAVFDTDSHPGGRLRVALADRSPRQVNPLLGVAAALLDLAAGRVTAPELLDLAGRAPVRFRFGLDDDALEQLTAWVVASGVRWGLDRDHRRPWQLDTVLQGTWQAGLDRVLTGVALPEAGALFGHTLPLDEVDSGDVDLAGRLAELVDRLGAAVRALQGSRPVEAWLDALQDAVLALTDVPPDGAWQLAQLGRELDEVRAAAVDAGAELTLADVTALLADRLAGRPTTTSFRTGGLTVCTLTPMRSVPHRVICLLGLDDGAFPRHGVPDGDDLLARDPHVGERDPRSEDRQLFLDALLAAQEHLVVTYAARDVRTDAPLAPAVPLSELLDALDATAATASGTPAREQVVIHHPLQPFAPSNFTDGALGRPGPLSFDRAALAGARSAAGERQGVDPLGAELLPARPPEPDVALRDLVDFFQHPAKAFLRQRLSVTTGGSDEDPADALPIELDGLQEWAVGDRLLAARLAGASPEALVAAERARGEIPPLSLGQATLSKVGSRVDRIVHAAKPWTSAEPTTVDVDVVLPGGRRLLGAVNGVRGGVAVTVTYSSVKAKQRMRAWVELLALAACAEQEMRAVVIGRGWSEKVSVVTLGPVGAEEARQALAELVAIRDAGMCCCLPLPIAASEAYAATRHRGSSAEASLGAARKEWLSGFGFPKEDADPEHALAWGGVVPFEELVAVTVEGGAPGSGFAREPTDFQRLARRVWHPLLAAEQVSAA